LYFDSRNFLNIILFLADFIDSPTQTENLQPVFIAFLSLINAAFNRSSDTIVMTMIEIKRKKARIAKPNLFDFIVFIENSVIPISTIWIDRTVSS